MFASWIRRRAGDLARADPWPGARSAGGHCGDAAARRGWPLAGRSAASRAGRPTAPPAQAGPARAGWPRPCMLAPPAHAGRAGLATPRPGRRPRLRRDNEGAMNMLQAIPRRTGPPNCGTAGSIVR